MSYGSLPFVHIDINNQKLFRITKGIVIKSERNSKKSIAKQVYLAEEMQNRVWTVILTCEINEENKEESRNELISHICQVYKSANPNPAEKKTSVIDQINSEIGDLEEQLDSLIKELDSSPKEEEIKRKSSKKDEVDKEVTE